jgi:hypothetical protein
VIIQITANDTRTVEQKQAFFARVAALLAESPGLRKEDTWSNAKKKTGRSATALRSTFERRRTPLVGFGPEPACLENFDRVR